MKIYTLKAYYECGEKEIEFIVSDDYDKVIKYQSKLEILLNKWVNYYISKYYNADGTIKTSYGVDISPRLNFFMTVGDTFIIENTIDCRP